MRFLSSVALAKADRLIFAASCSAADAIYVILGLTLLALGEEPHAVAHPAQHARGDQRRAVHGDIGFERARIKRPLQPAEVDDVEFGAKRHVAEAALGQAAVEWRLAALEAVEGDAGARGLALAAACAGHALARADAAADALGTIMGALVVSDVVEFHCPPPWPRRPEEAPAGLSVRGPAAAITRRRRPEPDASPARSCRAPPAYPRGRANGESC